MKSLRASELISLPVRLHGIQLGRPVDVLLDRDGFRALGFDVHCGDDIHRFLPLPTAVVAADEISIRSPLVMLEEDELAFYRARSFGLSALRGRTIERAGHGVGALVDVVIGADGSLEDLIVDVDGREERLPFGEDIRFEPKSRSAA